MMHLFEHLLLDLKIDKHYVKLHRTNDSIAICMVHEQWLQKLLSTYEIPPEFIKQGNLSDLECKYMLAHPTGIKSPWKLVSIYHLLKETGTVARFPKIQQQSKDLSRQNLTYSQLLHYIAETNFKNLWKEVHKKHSKGNIYERKDDVHIKTQEFNDAIRESVRRLYSCPIINAVRKEDTEKKSDSFQVEGSSPNVLGAYCLIETASSFYLLQPQLQYTLHDCLMFSPAIFGSSYCKPLFVIYQLLQGLRDIHDSGLFVGDFSLHDIGVDQNLWVQINPRLWEFLKKELSYKAEINKESKQALWNKSELNAELTLKSLKTFLDQQKVRSNPEIYLNNLVENWVHGDISNFDYLMELNYLAGRRMGNPNNHPVLPWIMDFTSPNGSWRDLSKSKYRLNKGDRQLDMMFEMLPSATSLADLLQVPHHVSDVLTDITYFVYMARRIPRNVLCQHVRRNWVPAEYPSSMQRMQEWTPDECIPEFFTDPSVFVSIHEDLPDLEIPSWAKDPEDFIHKHKAALESDYVSERLHNWIDLTFGYKLSGAAAIKSKNVCLHLVDQHTNLTNSGIVQLFQQPHPHKLVMSCYHGKHPPKLHRHLQAKDIQKKDKYADDISSANKDCEEENLQLETQMRIFTKQKPLKSKNSETKSGSEIKAESHPELLPILLPKDYNPLMSLNQMEMLYNFTAKTLYRVSNHTDTQTVASPHALYQRKIRDMISFGCIVVEIFLENRLRCLPAHTTLEERYEFISKILKTDFFELPRCIRHVTKLILQLDSKDDKENSSKRNGLPLRYPAITEDGLPPPSAHQLLQPLVRLFPFPSYFQNLYSFLSEIKEYKDTMALIENISVTQEVKNDLIEKLCESLVKRTAVILPKLLGVLTPEAIDIIVPYLKEMFDNPLTNVLAAWYLFDPTSQVLGPQQTKRTFLVPLIRLYDSETFTLKSLKLFHRSYLLKLIIRLGLQTFLTHFITRLIEAVGGYKDSAPNDSTRNDYLDRAHQSSPLHSPSLEMKNRDIFETILSPYDDDLSNEGLNVSSKSDVETTDIDPETEPEMFVFEAVTDDLNADNIDVFFVDHLEQKFESSDSADAVSLSEGPMESARSPATEEVQMSTLDVPEIIKSIPSSVPRSFDSSNKYSGESTNLCSTSVPNTLNALFTESKIDCDNENESDSIKKPQVILSPSNKSNCLKNAENNVSDVALESISWLSFRLGPVLTAKYLSRNLLRMLSLCYYGKEQILFTSVKEALDESISISQKVIVGDLHVIKVLECLASIAALYGEHFILLQYLPHVTDLVLSCKRKITPNLEAGLIGSLMLLKYIVPYLSDKALMDNIQDVLIENILNPTVRLISSQRLSFPNKGQAREVIAFKFLDVLYLIGLRIGFEMTRKHLTSVLCRFFESFERVYDPSKTNFDLSSEFKVEPKPSEDDYLPIKKDEVTNEYAVGTPISISEIKGLASKSDQADSSEEHIMHKDDSLEELKQIFTPELAYTAYVPFCRLAGGIHMEQSLTNEELIRNLCTQYDREMNGAPEGTETAASNSEIGMKSSERTDSSWKEDESVVSGSFGKNVAMIGNRIDIQLDDENVVASEMPVISSPPGEMSKLADFPKYSISKLISKKMENNQRHLRGTWLAYWEHEIGRNEKDLRFNFKQIKLQSFSGHTNTVKAIYCFDNENSFISASKDKSVKLWSLRSHGDGSAHSSCHWTYSNHKKSVFAVTFLESLRLIGSCDSAVHLWDPFMGSCIKQFDSTKNSPVTVLAAMPAPSPVLIAGTTEATIRFLDARLLKYIHEYKVSIGPAGLIRCITVSPDGHWLAVGHSSGVISILDVRTGLMTGSWKGHEGEILQIKAFDNNIFVTSSLDHCISVWNADDGKLQSHLRGPTEPVHCLSFYKNEMISATTANRIGVHTSVDNLASFSSTRLRSETFKGVVTSLTVLPLNRILLLGADNGMIRLLC